VVLMMNKETSLSEEIRKVSKATVAAIGMLTFAVILMIILIVLLVHGQPDQWVPVLMVMLFLLIFGFSLYREE